MSNNHPNHILLFNMSSQQWNCFHRLHGVPLIAEDYGRPISVGYTIDECVDEALGKGVKRWDIEVIE